MTKSNKLIYFKINSLIYIAELLKIQIKTAENVSDDGSIHFRTKYTPNNRKNITKKYTKDDIDYFILYSLELDECYMVPIEDITTSSFYIRIKTSKNKQNKNIHFREDYLLENILCVETLHGGPK